MPDEPQESEEELERRLRKLLGEAEDADADELDAIELKLRSLEDQLEAKAETRKADDGFFDAEFEERLENLHAKADEARTRQQSVKQDKERTQRLDQQSARGAGIGLSIAYTIIGVPLMGAAIGWFIDKQAGTTTWVGICTLLGAVLGVTMAVVMINRTNFDK